VKDLIAQPSSDAVLLERFAALGEEAAFSELVDRHGPLVLAVCRRILPNFHDAEEVFQATFLLLARKADVVSWTDSVEGWLFAAARRLALRARAGACRRRNRERPFFSLSLARPERAGGALPERYHPLCDSEVEIARRDMSQALRGALGQLPEQYRAVVELCYLEGKTSQEAARQLGWPAGSMSRRLKRARSLLRHRLVQMGITLIFLTCASYAILAAWPKAAPNQMIGPTRGAPTRCFQATYPPQADLPAMLQRILRSGQITESREQVGVLARTAGRVAVRTAGEAPQARSALWLDQAERMRLASLDLGEAARFGDDGAIVEAARRLDATCLACHAVFRP
jgi:RNA polymerase sigma-70 factor (ECF subfamily)